MVDVWPCGQDDLAELERLLPLGARGHADRLGFQRAGHGVYLVAVAAQPIGSCLVHWEGPAQASIKHLHVSVPARGRGVGRALIAAAERTATERGTQAISIGVSDDNPRARRLYEALGHRPGGERYRAEYDYRDADGRERHAVEAGDVLVKPLSPASPTGPAAGRGRSRAAT